MKAHSKRDSSKEREKFHSAMGITSADGGFRMNHKDRDTTVSHQVIPTEANFKRGKETEQEFIHIKMVISIGGSGKTTLKRAMDEFRWPLVMFTKDNGGAGRRVAGDNTNLRMGICMWVHFIRE